MTRLENRLLKITITISYKKKNIMVIEKYPQQ